MTQVITDRRDIEFVIHEQLEAENLSQLHENFADFNKKTINLVISEAKNFAVKELLPTNKEGDEQGCTLENGKVTTPDSFKRLYKIFNEGEWLDVLEGKAKVMDIEGHDVTIYFLKGAEYTLRLAEKYNIEIAILKEKSPSCGTHHIYDGHFDSTLIPGFGVTAAILEQNGIRVFSENELDQARALFR